MRAAACALTLVCLALSIHASDATDVAPPAPGLTPLFSNLPLLFVENRGQLDEAVRFSVPGSGRTLYFTHEGITVALEGDGQRWALKLDFVEANPDVVLRGEEAQQAVFSYFKGNDPEKWQAGCPTYAKIVYENLWPGIGLVYRGEVNRLKHEFVVAPGADPRRIRFAVRGATAVRLDAEGDLVLGTPLGSFEDAHPTAYQERDGVRTGVSAAFALEGAQVGFTLGAFDPTLPLVLDPETIVYSSYLGGSDEDIGFAIAMDATGAAYVTGATRSPDFPLQVEGGGWGSYGGFWDTFVAKVDPTGSTLVYSGLLGGSSVDEGLDIVVDAAGAAYVAGGTESPDFPTAGPLGPTFNGGYWDNFLTKIDPTGTSLVYSGFLGGSHSDLGGALAVDAAGAVYMTGNTNSPDFPTVGPLGPSLHGSHYDAFVLKVDPTGSALLYSGLIGGSDDDSGISIAVDATGAAYLTGLTISPDFPTIFGPDLTFNGWRDAFVLKVDPTGSALLYSGYLGGSDSDIGRGIAVDASGAAYVTGSTESPNFPVAVGPDLSFNGIMDAFVAKIAANGERVWSGYLGGSYDDEGRDIVVEASGAACVTGFTYSPDFPIGGGFLDSTYHGLTDAFVTKVAADGTRLLCSGFLGGDFIDRGYGLAVSETGVGCVTGETSSNDFPTVEPLYPSLKGQRDAFITKILVPGAELECRPGGVGDPPSTTPAIVLRINGSEGDADRVVITTIGSPLAITMDVPPSGPNPAPFAIYGWLGQPSASTVTPQPMNLGRMCFPTPMAGGYPQPNRIWNNLGHYPFLGYPHFPSEPAPSTLLSKVWGVPFAVTATFQGFVLDDGSSADKPASITNAVILKVNP